MKCVYCQHNRTVVYNSRPQQGTIKRHRKCHNCKRTFITVEVLLGTPPEGADQLTKLAKTANLYVTYLQDALKQIERLTQ